MDPLTIGVLSASVIAGLGGAGWAGLKAWNGWLELKRIELTHDVAATGHFRRRAAGSRSRTSANASASSRRSPPASISELDRPSALLPRVRKRKAVRRPYAGPPLLLG